MTSRKALRTRKPRQVESEIPLPESLFEAIEDARATLGKADSFLRCLTISLEAESNLYDGPYYPDISDLARQLVRQAFNELDSVNLRTTFLRGAPNKRKSALKPTRAHNLRVTSAQQRLSSSKDTSVRSAERPTRSH
jgi:hypothetical protein